MNELTPEMMRKARYSVGETQVVFAKRFDVNQSTIHEWETVGPPAKGASRKLIEIVLADLGTVSSDN